AVGARRHSPRRGGRGGRVHARVPHPDQGRAARHGAARRPQGAGRARYRIRRVSAAPGAGPVTRPAWRVALGVVLAALGSFRTLPLPAQTAPAGRTTVIAGAHYGAGWLHRLLLGAHYRDLWTTPLEVDVLDLSRVAGGLTPSRCGGRRQTKSLRLLGMVEGRPTEPPDNEPGFAGAAELASTKKLFEHLENDADHRIDSRAFLAARLMDVFIGDWDRHHDQWRWARFDSGGVHWWR